MMTVIARFPVPEGIVDADLTDIFARRVPICRAVRARVRKCYCRSEDGRGGGIHLPTDASSARAFFDDALWARISEKSGEPVTVELPPTLVVLDTACDEIRTATGSGWAGAPHPHADARSVALRCV